jgi:hypothetical protein
MRGHARQWLITGNLCARCWAWLIDASPLDVTVDELVVETFCPAGEPTADALRRQPRPFGL